MDRAHAAAAAIAVANPKLVGAYELLAEIHQARGEESESLEALRKAETIVPSAKRARALGEMAVRIGNMEVAKTAYAKVVAATRNSFTKSPYDNAALAQIYLDTGDSAKALEVLKPVQQEFGSETGFQAIAAAVEARAYAETGDVDAASAALERALEFVKDADPAAALAVSKACFALGKEAEGELLVSNAVRANHEDAQLLAAARKVLKDAGREEVTSRLVDAQVQEVLGLTERALALAKKAQLTEAQAIIAEALAGMPGNVGVLVAATQINLLFLSQKGLDIEVATRVRAYLATLETLAQGTERVVKMGAFFKELLLKARAGAAA
jgi:tetratricopeptide (TPR) repeat protein